MATQITPEELEKEVGEHKPLQLIDVRSPGEYAAGHIPCAVNLPLDELSSRTGDLGKAPIVLICLGGQRAQMAADRLKTSGIDSTVLSGGTKAWMSSGLPLVRSQRSGWDLERQVRFTAGLLVLIGALLALTVNMYWVWLSAAIGLGLTVSGFTGACPMGMILAKMPWNKKPLANACNCKP